MSERTVFRSGLLLWVACLSSAALVSLLLNVWSGPVKRDGSAGIVEPRATDPGAARLEARLAELEERIRTLEAIRSLATPREPVSASESAVARLEDEALAELDERLNRLEAFEQTRQQPGGRWPDREPFFDPTRQLTERDERDAAHAIIFDPETTDSEKAHAWLDLAGLEADPWTDPIVAAMTHIGATSTDDRAREVVWIGADTHHRSDLLVQPLIAALSDPVANVREEAADALGHYLDVPGVRAALLWTRANDASAQVREEAARVLGEG